jgi:hypothetical protein
MQRETSAASFYEYMHETRLSSLYQILEKFICLTILLVVDNPLSILTGSVRVDEASRAVKANGPD